MDYSGLCFFLTLRLRGETRGNLRTPSALRLLLHGCFLSSHLRAGFGLSFVNQKVLALKEFEECPLMRESGIGTPRALEFHPKTLWKFFRSEVCDGSKNFDSAIPSDFLPLFYHGHYNLEYFPSDFLKTRSSKREIGTSQIHFLTSELARASTRELWKSHTPSYFRLVWKTRSYRCLCS